MPHHACLGREMASPPSGWREDLLSSQGDWRLDLEGVLLLLIVITTNTEWESVGTEKSRNKASFPP